MHIQIVTFAVSGLTEEGYLEAGAQLAPAGLLAKIWLAEPEGNGYGGVYLWRDRAAMEGYMASDLFQAIAAFPHFTHVASHDFAVHDDLTRVTQPGLPVLALA